MSENENTNNENENNALGSENENGTGINLSETLRYGRSAQISKVMDAFFPNPNNEIGINLAKTNICLCIGVSQGTSDGLEKNKNTIFTCLECLEANGCDKENTYMLRETVLLEIERNKILHK